MRVRRQVSGALAALLVGTGVLALSAGPTAAQRSPGADVAAGASCWRPILPVRRERRVRRPHYDLDLTYAAGAGPGAALSAS